ncbi:MAG: hypothetical protein RBR71_12150 [Gudongella sp.]|nr:hypothetical protein [Gudongella sp.]
MKNMVIMKLAATMVVLTVLAVPAAVVLGEPVDAATEHSVSMFVGDSIAYTPATNLESEITPSGSAMTAEGGFLSFSAGTISGTPTTAGIYTLTVTAVWSSGSLTQTAVQNIHITVHAHTVFTSSGDVYLVNGDHDWSHTVTATGSGTITYSEPVIPVELYDEVSWNDEDHTLFTVGEIAAPAGAYAIMVTATASASGESATQTITVTVYDDLAITSPSTVETYVGQTISYEITTNYDDDIDDVTTSASMNTVASVSSLTFSAGTISGAFNSSADSSASPWYKSYSVAVSASGSVDGVALVATKTITFKVWASLAFTSAPNTSNVAPGAATGDPLRMVLSATVTGASSIVYSWGDGTRTIITPDTPDDAVYTLAHSYATDGTYVVTVSAANSKGTSSSYVFYDAGSGSWSFASAEDTMSSMIDSHGILFLVLGVSGVLALAVWIVGVRDTRLLLTAVALVVSSIACYLAGFTGGL